MTPPWLPGRSLFLPRLKLLSGCCGGGPADRGCPGHIAVFQKINPPGGALPPLSASLTVILASQYLGGDVVGGAAERAGRIAGPQALLQKHKSFDFLSDFCTPGRGSSFTVRCHPHLAHAVVGELDVSLRVQQHVVQLQVSVDDPSLVQVVQRQADLSRVEPDRSSQRQ